RVHVLADLVVLLEHRPVQAFEAIAVEEAPYVALPALDLAAAPEVHLRGLRVDRGGEADDVERAARAELLLVGNRQAHPVRAGLAPFHPAAVDARLVRPLPHEAGT